MVTGRFFARHTDTGALTDADSLPTAAIYLNGTVAGSVTVTITNITTGIYTYSFTLPADWSRGDHIQCEVSATVDSTSDIGTVIEFTLESALGLEFTVDDTSITPTTTYCALNDGPAGDDVLNGRFLVFSSGANKGLALPISDYNGTTKQVNFATAWPTAPVDGDQCEVIGLTV